MLNNIISGLVTAWFLSLFGFDTMFVSACGQFGIKINADVYYVLFALLGVITRYIK